MHVDLGGYHVRDIEFTAAFDVTTDKVGKDLAEAIWARPNDTIKFAHVPKTGVRVSRGITHDGIGKYLSEVVEKAPGGAARAGKRAYVGVSSRVRDGGCGLPRPGSVYRWLAGEHAIVKRVADPTRFATDLARWTTRLGARPVAGRSGRR